MDKIALLHQLDRAADELDVVRIMIEYDQQPLALQRLRALRQQLDELLTKSAQVDLPPPPPGS